MRFKSGVLAEASGSVGGYTYSHNAGGQYIRQRSIPTDPNTSQQQAVRSSIAQLVNAWVNALTADQRAAWNTYAANTPISDVFGDPRNRSGINHYCRSNTPILQAALTRVDDGPTVFNLGDYTEPSVAFDAAADEVDVTFDNTDDWANEDGAAMLVYCSRPQNPSVNFFKGPYRYAGKIAGDGETPPTSPASIALPFDVAAGQKVFARIVVVRADGRLSTPFRGGAIAA
jgi:hypothetical protein